MIYAVTWEIELEAETPKEAALKALQIQRDPDSLATVFTVKRYGRPSESYEIDLTQGEDQWP